MRRATADRTCSPRRPSRCITRASGGLTRRINILADKALLSAFAADTHAVDEKHVQRAVSDSELPPVAKAKRPLAYVAIALLIGAMIGVGAQWALTNTTPETASAPDTMAANQPQSTGASTARIRGTRSTSETDAGCRCTEATACESRSRVVANRAGGPGGADRQAGGGGTFATNRPSDGAGGARRDGEGDPAARTGASGAESLTRDRPGHGQGGREIRAGNRGRAGPLLPKQIERIDAYATGGQPLLGERIAAAREVLQTAPDDALTIELYRSLNTDPARIERFLIRARGLETLPTLYVVPLTRSPRTRVWVVYGAFATREQAEEALRRLPQTYHQDFKLTLRRFAELRGAI